MTSSANDSTPSPELPPSPAETKLVRKQLNAIFQRIVSTGFSPAFRADGFAKIGATYRKEISDKLCWIVRFDHGSYIKNKSKVFSLRFGPYPYRFWPVFCGFPEWPDTFTGMSCPVDEILGRLEGDPFPGWIELRVGMSETEIDAIAAQVRLRVERFIIPWLNQFRTIGEIIEQVLIPRKTGNPDSPIHQSAMAEKYRRAAALYFLDGDHAAALACLDTVLLDYPFRYAPEAMVEYQNTMRRMVAAAAEQADDTARG